MWPKVCGHPSPFVLRMFFIIWTICPLVPIKGNLNVAEYNDILDSSVLPTRAGQYIENITIS